MPLKLIPPRPGKTPYWSVRGTYLGRYVDRSTKARKRAVAAKLLLKWQEEIERGEFATSDDLDFATAALNYMKAGGERRFLTPLIKHFAKTPLHQIKQADVDAAALQLHPEATPATRNRQVYSPISAILKHAGADYDFKLRRPKGSRGRVVTRWLWPEQAFAIFDAAAKLNREFEVLLRFLCYTGCRISEALRLTCDELRLKENFAYVRTSKNGEPRPVFIPPHLAVSLTGHPRGLDRGASRVFRFHQGGGMRNLLIAATAMASGLPKPKREKRSGQPVKRQHDLDWVNFHTFCHTYATWMRRYAGLDTKGLVGTGRWRSEQSASRYAHVVPTEDARAAQMLPTPMAKRDIR
jgi:integrase